MASLKDLRRRIASVQNTRKTTRAMKLVSAAKLRRAQQDAVSHREYADRLRKLVWRLAAEGGREQHPLLAETEGDRTLVVLITSDRGLCGGFNSNISRATQRWVLRQENPERVKLRFIGRKGGDYFRARKGGPEMQRGEALPPLAADTPDRLTEEVGELFTGGEFDRIVLAYNKFVSALTQEVTFEQLLPLSRTAGGEKPELIDVTESYLYEPSRQAVLDELLPAYLSRRVQQAIYESVAAEHGARMTAMDSATRNASEMIDRLTLDYNRARQAAITTELMEIISGAESLKG